MDVLGLIKTECIICFVLHALRDALIICILLNMHCKTQNASCVLFNIVQIKQCDSFTMLNLIYVTQCAYCIMLRLIKTKCVTCFVC